jgi:Restriction endonuclease BsobI
MYLYLEKTAVMNLPYLAHLNQTSDLETTYEAIRSGFISLALEKNQRSSPLVEEARVLKRIAETANNPQGLFHITDIQAALLTASGISEKAKKYLQPQDKQQAILELIENFLEPAGNYFVDELVYRFLLIRGDALGGIMRNAGGRFAQRKLTRAILATLKIAGIPYRWLNRTNDKWQDMGEFDSGLEEFIQGITWRQGTRDRTLIFNITVPIVRNNIDLCLLQCPIEDFKKKAIVKDILQLPDSYLALGELKGGIDPAGADEHWKTARTALDRIREAFQKVNHQPNTFFIGAAIESRMAAEIWERLESRQLTNAANLTDERQLLSLTRWLCSL